MIIVRTNCDLATEYTYAWTEPIITEAQARGFKVTLVQGNNVGIQHFNKRIHKIKPKLIMFNGHGSKNCFYDNNWEELMNLNSVHLLKNSITFARACDCLIELGSKAVQEGCLAFIGYNRKFMIPRWHSQTCKPLSDPAAKPVMECSNSVVLELLKNKTVEEAVLKSHEISERMMVDLIYSPEPFASATLQSVIHNDSSLDFKGKGAVRI